MKTPVNKQTLRNHFTYSWWKYLLVLVGGIFLVDLLFTVTAPRVPEEKKVEFYVYGYSDSDAVTKYLDRVHEEDLSDMESVISVRLTTDETYGAMQLSTYIAVHEGDLYLLPREEFLSLSAVGSFLPLENDEALMSLFNEAGKDLKRGWRTLSESDETHLYGIPMDLLPGLQSMCYAENGYLAVLAMGGNTDNTMTLLRRMVKDTINEPVPVPETESPAPETPGT